MVGLDTEKVLATCSLGLPASTAESTLNLRSFEYGFMPGDYHIWIDTYGYRCRKPVLLACGDAGIEDSPLWAVAIDGMYDQCPTSSVGSTPRASASLRIVRK